MLCSPVHGVSRSLLKQLRLMRLLHRILSSPDSYETISKFMNDPL